jgi:Flp pilus assembly protein TadG
VGASRAADRRADEGIRHRRQDGNVLVLFALLLTLFLLCGAIAVDVGYWWVAGRKAQIAADACALAAAQELPRTYAIVAGRRTTS